MLEIIDPSEKDFIKLKSLLDKLVRNWVLKDLNSSEWNNQMKSLTIDPKQWIKSEGDIYHWWPQQSEYQLWDWYKIIVSAWFTVDDPFSYSFYDSSGWLMITISNDNKNFDSNTIKVIHIFTKKLQALTARKNTEKYMDVNTRNALDFKEIIELIRTLQYWWFIDVVSINLLDEIKLWDWLEMHRAGWYSSDDPHVYNFFIEWKKVFMHNDSDEETKISDHNVEKWVTMKVSEILAIFKKSLINKL